MNMNLWNEVVTGHAGFGDIIVFTYVVASILLFCFFTINKTYNVKKAMLFLLVAGFVFSSWVALVLKEWGIIVFIPLVAYVILVKYQQMNWKPRRAGRKE